MCRQFKITGRVQGVFFRDSTQRIADDLKLTGHAINLSDGSVEVVACGPEERINKLRNWLQDGPPLGVVDQVSEYAVDCSAPMSFTTG